MQIGKILYLLVSLTLLSACQEKGGSDGSKQYKITQNLSIVNSIPVIWNSVNCPDHYEWSYPKIGTQFSYSLLDKDGSPVENIIKKDKIIRLIDGKVHFESEMTSAGVVIENSREYTHYGVLNGESVNRSWTYSGRAPSDLTTLKPGETLILTGTETARLRDGVKTHEGPIKVTFIGCGQARADIPGATKDRLRIYSIDRFWQTPEGIRRGVREVAVSEKTGWVMMDRSGGATGAVLNMTAP